MPQSTNPPPDPDEAWEIRHARKVLAASKAAPSEREQAARWWGKCEAALEFLLDHLDRQEGGK